MPTSTSQSDEPNAPTFSPEEEAKLREAFKRYKPKWNSVMLEKMHAFYGGDATPHLNADPTPRQFEAWVRAGNSAFGKMLAKTPEAFFDAWSQESLQKSSVPKNLDAEKETGQEISAFGGQSTP